MNWRTIRKNMICALIVFLFASCEPVSVSVNSKGEIAFARSEGVFFFDAKSGKISVVDWNLGKETVPAIVRWAPDGETIAVTIKESSGSQETMVYLIDKKGKKKKLHAASNVVTQLEWSTDGAYLSIAQAGSDSDMGVADIVLVAIKDGMSKTLCENTGDVHRWIDDKNIALIKISEKNPNNSEILKGELSIFSLASNELVGLVPVVVSKTGSLDCARKKKEIVFTALKVGEAAVFAEEMENNSAVYMWSIGEKTVTGPIENMITDYVLYSPDETKVLVKVKNPDSYNVVDLAYYDIKGGKLATIVPNTLNTVTANSVAVQVYPTWLDSGRVLYMRMNNTYGANGQSIQLFGISLADSKKVNYQVAIDTEIGKLVDKKGGY